MKKEYVLKNKIKFNEVIQKGKKVKNNNFIIYFLPNFEIKIGIAISKKMGNAPQRNYHKRVIRNICRDHMDDFENKNYVIICRENIKKITYDQKEKSLIDLFERIVKYEK